MSDPPPVLTPRLICADADAALAFYAEVFGARVLERYATPGGAIVHAALSIRGAIVSVADASVGGLDEPGGSAILLTLSCEDPDAVAQAAVAHGATVVIPIEDRFYGHREGRIRDPFGHRWILSRKIRDLSPEQIEAGVEAFDAG